MVLAKGEIESMTLVGRTAKVRIRNTGNVHFTIQRILLRSGEASQSENGWYLLPGAARTYTIPLDSGLCHGAGKLEATVKTSEMELSGHTTCR